MGSRVARAVGCAGRVGVAVGLRRVVCMVFYPAALALAASCQFTLLYIWLLASTPTHGEVALYMLRAYAPPKTNTNLARLAAVAIAKGGLVGAYAPARIANCSAPATHATNPLHQGGTAEWGEGHVQSGGNDSGGVGNGSGGGSRQCEPSLLSSLPYNPVQLHSPDMSRQCTGAWQRDKHTRSGRACLCCKHPF